MFQQNSDARLMKDEAPDYPNIRKVKEAAVVLINFALALLVTFVIIRLGELFYILSENDIPEEFWEVATKAALFDLVFCLKLTAFLFIPFLCIYFLNRSLKVNFWVFGTLGTLIIILDVFLIKYFGTALVPLGSDLFGYSVSEIQQTVAASNSIFDVMSVCLILIPLISFWILLSFFSSRRLVKSPYAYLILGAGGLFASFGVSALPSSAAFKNEFAYNLSLNKAAFFTESSLSYFAAKPELVENPGIDLSEAVAGFKPFKYVNPEYPFLREDDSKDVLGDFFEIDSLTKPNIVFIQVEGLGRAFSGKNAYLRSFTPFLDDLADKGLYWENFVASQGRTFASLPSILASLPFGGRGFSDIGTQMPKHFSLLNILNQNGYVSKYFGGFEMDFDNQGLFMTKAGANLIVSSDDFGRGYEKGSSWGYADRDLMQKFLEIEASNSQQPFVSYLETISMHTPYTVPNQAEYVKLFEDRMKQLGFDGTKQASYNQYKKIYSSIMYTDDAIRHFFNEYTKIPSYKNTIFIITGDHRLPEIPMSTKIDRYHVPLIIYSPMLKRTASFKSVSSHLDITPSLVAFMKRNYRINAPTKVAWVGSGLDTALALRNIHKYPLKQTTNSLHNYLSGLHFIDQDQLFTISGNMNLEPVRDDKVLKQVQDEFNAYKIRNDRFKRELKLIPDNLYRKIILK